MKELQDQPECYTDGVSQQGVITGENAQSWFVTVMSKSACSGCHAKGLCTTFDSRDKVIEVPKKKGIHYQSGEQVNVVIKESEGSIAVILAYFVPFVILIATLMITWSLTGNEGLAGLAALIAPGLYYAGLWFLRPYLKKRFIFRIR